VLKRTMMEFKQDNLTDWAAALTYYGVLSIFPALLALVSVLGLLGSSTIKPLIDNLGSLAPGAARDILNSMLTQLQSSLRSCLIPRRPRSPRLRPAAEGLSAVLPKHAPTTAAVSE
jgi:uncharacterized BrkB/YihY/UPF0761 family membrane protein